jgi:diguanylate cyclase (GGDEF)-like protein
VFATATSELRRERLGRFLHLLAPSATIFGLTEAWVASRFGDQTSLRAALVILLYSGAVLIAARIAVRRSADIACGIASASTLVAAMVLVIVEPRLNSAIAFAPLLAAVIAYPYLGGIALGVLLGAALVATGAIAFAGPLLPAVGLAPPQIAITIRSAVTTAIAAFIAYFLWQYRQQIESHLRGAAGRRQQLERAITELTGREREARRLALRDALTGVANRRLLLDRLEETLRDPRPDDRLAALVFLDLDGFKRINDELGHERGDRLLVDVAHALEGAVRKTDLLARFGGDEFALLMPRVSSASEPEQVARRLLGRLKSELEPLPNELRVAASVGLAMAPHHGTTPEGLLRAADAAMYGAKVAGGERFAWPGPTELPTLKLALPPGAAS